MAWANCPTHGPIQDARSARKSGRVVLSCVCNLICEPYSPESFVEHDELKVLVGSHRQPKEDHETPDTGPEGYESIGGGWYLLPDGRKVQGLEAAEEAMEE